MRDAAINLIKELSGQYGVDANLALNLFKHESDFNQQAISPKGAIGVAQLMPDTARGLGVDPHDLRGNITGGLMYLRDMARKFPNRPDLQVAAYNAGPNAVTKYGGVPPFKETAALVARVLGKNPPINSKPEKEMANDPLRKDVYAGNPLVASVEPAGFNPQDFVQQLQGVVRGAAGPGRGPVGTPYTEQDIIPQEGRAAPMSESGLQLAQVLGALAGVASPEYGKAGGAIAALAGGELETARKNRAAQSLGYYSWDELVGSKAATEAEYTKAATGAAAARGLSEAGKALETGVELPGKQSYNVFLPGSNSPIALTGKNLMDSVAGGLNIQMNQRELEQVKIPHVQAYIQHMNVLNSMNTKSIPLPGMKDAQGNTALGTPSDYINLLARTDPIKAAKQSANFQMVNEMIKSKLGMLSDRAKSGMPIQKPLELFTAPELKALAPIIVDMHKEPGLRAIAESAAGLAGIVIPGQTEATTKNPTTQKSPLPPRPVLPGPQAFPGFE